MLAAGTSLGRYRILAPLGAGGMGEVYRAHDSQLGRAVAIKVLAAHLAALPEVRTRFEREARTISHLSHANICTVYDVGHQDGVDYLVMELLEGETLSRRIARGPLPVADVLSIGRQVAAALARAHQSGVVHRDLKPGNVMLTKSGAKLMDFGLARAVVPPNAPGGRTQVPTISDPLTAEGSIVGTPLYMSPEQLEGREVDARSDLWAMGCVLYEMTTGVRPFRGESQASLIAAILREEPRPVLELRPVTPPALERVITRCLAKDPDDRFQNASDLAFDLDEISSASNSGKGVVPKPSPRDWRGPAAAAIALVVLVAAGYLTGRGSLQPDPEPYERVTFRRGSVGTARFTPDGQSVVYGARWIGERANVYIQRLTGTDARELGIAGNVVGVAGNEVALLRGTTLSRVSLDGGTPRDVASDVVEADWSRDGKTFAIVRSLPESLRLECPPGRTVLTESKIRFIDFPRLSPRGDRIAYRFMLNPATNWASTIVVTDLAGRRQTLTRAWDDISTLAWSPDGKEIWFTAAMASRPRALWSVTLAGRERLRMRLPGTLNVLDAAPDGRLLFTHATRRWEMRGRTARDTAERDLSWLDGSSLGQLSPDGTQLVFTEQAEGARSGEGATYLRRLDDGSPAVRLADNSSLSVSPDWKWTVGVVGSEDSVRLVLAPVGAGERRELPRGTLERIEWATFAPTGERLLVWGNEAGRPRRLFLQDLEGGPPKPVTPEGTGNAAAFSADGRYVLAKMQNGPVPDVWYAIDGGEPQPIPGKRWLRPGETPQWYSPDGRSVIITDTQEWRPRATFTKVDLASGARQPWLAIEPPDPVGIEIFYPTLGPDARSYLYFYQRMLSSDLFVMKRPR